MQTNSIKQNIRLLEEDKFTIILKDFILILT